MSTTSTITRTPGTMMHNPPHPGEVLREGWLTPLELSVTAAAEHFGIARKTLSEILNGQAGISAPMALRLSQALGTTAEHWLTLQAHYDLWQARRMRIRVPKLVWPIRAVLLHSPARAASDLGVRMGGRARKANTAIASLSRKAALHRKARKSR